MFPAGIGTTELVIIGIVAVLLFGSKLPEVAKNLGKSYQQFRRSLSDLQANFTADGDSRTRTAAKRVEHYKDAADEADPPLPRFEPPTEPAETSSANDSNISA